MDIKNNWQSINQAWQRIKRANPSQVGNNTKQIIYEKIFTLSSQSPYLEFSKYYEATLAILDAVEQKLTQDGDPLRMSPTYQSDLSKLNIDRFDKKPIAILIADQHTIDQKKHTGKGLLFGTNPSLYIDPQFKLINTLKDTSLLKFKEVFFEGVADNNEFNNHCKHLTGNPAEYLSQGMLFSALKTAQPKLYFKAIENNDRKSFFQHLQSSLLECSLESTLKGEDPFQSPDVNWVLKVILDCDCPESKTDFTPGSDKEIYIKSLKELFNEMDQQFPQMQYQKALGWVNNVKKKQTNESRKALIPLALQHTTLPQAEVQQLHDFYSQKSKEAEIQRNKSMADTYASIEERQILPLRVGMLHIDPLIQELEARNIPVITYKLKVAETGYIINGMLVYKD